MFRLLFTDARMRSLYTDGETVARTAASQLRMEAAKYPDDSRRANLVAELSVGAPEQQLVIWTAAEGAATYGALQQLRSQL